MDYDHRGGGGKSPSAEAAIPCQQRPTASRHVRTLNDGRALPGLLPKADAPEPTLVSATYKSILTGAATASEICCRAGRAIPTMLVTGRYLQKAAGGRLNAELIFMGSEAVDKPSIQMLISLLTFRRLTIGPSRRAPPRWRSHYRETGPHTWRTGPRSPLPSRDVRMASPCWPRSPCRPWPTGSR